LHALAASMNQADLTKSCRVSGGDVLLDHGRDVTGRERMQVEAIFDGDAVCHRGSAMPTLDRRR
jgi:hypothetical protein